MILDHVMPHIPNAEARCLLYICRRTFGFRKEEDNISLTQFERGIKSSQGRQLDCGTGLSRPAINTALIHLFASRAIFIHQNSYGNRFSLNLEMDVDKVVKEVNWLRYLTKTSKPTYLKLVKKVNTQKKGKRLEKNSIPLGVDILGEFSKELAEIMTANKIRL